MSIWDKVNPFAPVYRLRMKVTIHGKQRYYVSRTRRIIPRFMNQSYLRHYSQSASCWRSTLWLDRDYKDGYWWEEPHLAKQALAKILLEERREREANRVSRGSIETLDANHLVAIARLEGQNEHS